MTDYHSWEYEKFSKVSDYNYDRFCTLINSRKRDKQCAMILDMYDKILDEVEEIAEMWANCLKALQIRKC